MQPGAARGHFLSLQQRVSGVGQTASPRSAHRPLLQSFDLLLVHAIAVSVPLPKIIFLSLPGLCKDAVRFDAYSTPKKLPQTLLLYFFIIQPIFLNWMNLYTWTKKIPARLALSISHGWSPKNIHCAGSRSNSRTASSSIPGSGLRQRQGPVNSGWCGQK